MKKSLLALAAAGTALALSNCASFTPATAQADYNGDGAVSNAEYQQYNAQRNIEDRGVYSETVKRENAVRTIQDVDRGIQGFQNLGATLGINELSGGRRRGGYYSNY